MYYLLDLSGQSFLFATRTAAGFERTNLSLALEIYYQAALTAFRELRDHEAGYQTLDKIISLADIHEDQTDESEQTNWCEKGKPFSECCRAHECMLLGVRFPGSFCRTHDDSLPRGASQMKRLCQTFAVACVVEIAVSLINSGASYFPLSCRAC